ncbi:MAG: hypothetical protein R2795_03265 [Saprospiraceae bacterium]
MGIPDGVDGKYRFEGYKLFQFSGPNVSLADVDDPTKVRQVYQVDKQNGITKIFNWEGLSPDDNQTPTEEAYFVPELKVNGADQGIRHTFSIKEDQFASGDRRLINHKKYYFAAVAYGYNNYLEFDPTREGDPGQDRAYIESTRNIGDGENNFYTVIPRMILDRQLQAAYGEGAVITRIDGLGTGDNFLDINDETRTEIEKLIQEDIADQFGGEVTYKSGFGPINVAVFNPLEVRDGEYELTFTDDNMGNTELDAPTLWTLRSLTDAAAPVITAEKPIQDVNEQIIKDFGITVTIGQRAEPGSDPFNIASNGFRGYTEEYINPDASPWLFGIRDNLPIQTGNPVVDGQIFDFIATTNSTDADYELDPNQTLSLMGNGAFVPYYLCDWRAKESGVPYLTPAWTNSGNNNNIVRNQSSLADLNNVDIVFTSDKTKWSRCIVVESMNPAYEDAGFFSEGERNMFDPRNKPSVGKEAGPDGLPMPDGTGEGMGWFPGYAIDVETGQRLNIFFGENSVYNGTQGFGPSNGGDMMFNPSDDIFFPTPGGGVSPFNYPVGGQHFVYVTNTPYDECAFIADRFDDPSPLRKVAPLRTVTWAGMLISIPGTEMKSYADGLIPEDVIVKLRVDNSYKVAIGTGEFNGYPTYRFKLENKQALALDELAINEALQAINIVPNPYYGFSQYEDSQFENVVKISNLPQKCTVTIYSLDGKFIRKYERNELGAVPVGGNRAINRAQINPDIEWDLKNFRNIPVSSGVYLIHVAAPGLGERTLKWFGVNRQFDPSGL